ncbi:MAG: M2 family metallopeptidase, partial [Hyphomonas sp.]|nr:M2 family metallopeptidase [Hyphomonas sp.]
MSKLLKSVSAAALGLVLVSCSAQDRVDPAAVAAEEQAIAARTFLSRVETELAAMNKEAAQAFWNQATNITPETNAAAADAGARATKLAVAFANESKQFDVTVLPPDLARKVRILRGGITIPAPSREGAAEELSKLTTDLDAAYGTGKFEYQGKMITLDDASTIIETSRDPNVTKAVWEGWHTISPPMR